MSVNNSLPGVDELFRKSDDSFLGADDSLCWMGGSCRGTDAPSPATGNSFSSTNDSFQATDGSFPGADDPRNYKNGVISLKSQKLEVEKLTTKTKGVLFTTKTKRTSFTTKIKRTRRKNKKLRDLRVLRGELYMIAKEHYSPRRWKEHEEIK